ncbi:methionyl-tRNA synthetase, putative [Babesia ovata]|uniref:Methionyl-tRNA synthetase, putative n=1 Tax=Babesia ovata TaxID=189622 RepID=A0A2H6KD34_9APIC|nr:methionyl-tRNA synthetase, putative [Babesia ovata]GBE60897.1 methionyl-tRNA synthetase, putative [Babesia ovata]
MGAPPTDNNSAKGQVPTKGIALYANNAECRGNLNTVHKLYEKGDYVYRGLEDVLSAIHKSTASPKVKEAGEKECVEYLERVDKMLNDFREYMYLNNMLDEYDHLIRTLQRGHLTAERSARVSKKLSNLEQGFENREPFAKNMLTPDVTQYFLEKIGEAEAFFQKHKVPEPPKSNKLAQPKLSGSKTTPEATNQKQNTTEKNATRESGAEKAEETITCHARNTKDGNKSSGHMTLGIRVIQTLTALGLMAAL